MKNQSNKIHTWWHYIRLSLSLSLSTICQFQFLSLCIWHDAQTISRLTFFQAPSPSSCRRQRRNSHRRRTTETSPSIFVTSYTAQVHSPHSDSNSSLLLRSLPLLSHSLAFRPKSFHWIQSSFRYNANFNILSTHYY